MIEFDTIQWSRVVDKSKKTDSTACTDLVVNLVVDTVQNGTTENHTQDDENNRQYQPNRGKNYAGGCQALGGGLPAKETQDETNDTEGATAEPTDRCA
jgi:hypothetical protein